jgi:hypothetical protein
MTATTLSAQPGRPAQGSGRQRRRAGTPWRFPAVGYIGARLPPWSRAGLIRRAPKWRIAQCDLSTPVTTTCAPATPVHMQDFCEADAGTRTPDPFITSEGRRLWMFAAGSSFACSEADLALPGRTAFAAVSGCSIAHSLPTSISTGKLGFAPAGGSLWLQVLAPTRRRPRGCATRVRAHPAASRTLPCVSRKVRGRPAAGGLDSSRSARSTRRTIRAAELATSARAETWPETGQARSGVDRPACGGCATLPEANRALGPAHAECRGGDEQKRAAAPAELLTRVNTRSGVVRFNPANAGLPPRDSRAGFPPVWRLVRPIAAAARP